MESEYLQMKDEIVNLRSQIESVTKKNRRLIEELNRGGLYDEMKEEMDMIEAERLALAAAYDDLCKDMR